MQGATTSGRAGTGHERGDRDESVALLRAYHSSDDASARESAREKLVELHLPLVRSLARRYANRGEGLEDLVQVGSIGLLESIDRFDPQRGSDLASFAVPTITGVIKRHLRDRSTIVRMPRPLAEQARKPVCVSLVEGVSSEIDEAMQTDGAFDASEERLLLAAGFRALAPRERRILKLRFFAGLSQIEIAREVGLSQIQVSRLIRASLDRMRVALELGAGRAHDIPRPPLVPFGSSLYTRTMAGASPLARDVPESGEDSRPKKAASRSGRLLVRMPATLHDELATAAEVEGVSLNQFITSALADAVEWEQDDESVSARKRPWSRAAPSRVTWFALSVNLIVALIAGAAAITLLVVAWQQGW